MAHNTPRHQMRRKELAQEDAWIVEFLQQAAVGYVATRADDQPFITPTTFWYDAERHTIYFHSNIAGRLRSNSEAHPEVCFSAAEWGKLLPSNIALEFSIQYASVVAFGKIRVLTDSEEKRRALQGLISRYFPEMQAGKEYRPISDSEVKRTAVYAIQVEDWSGKMNWPDEAIQSDEWPALSLG